MQKYKVLINGENLLTEEDGVLRRFGFYTNVFVEAFTIEDAEARAIEVIREDQDLAGILMNPDDDPLCLSAEEVQEIESFEGHRIPRDAFMLYPETER